MNSVKRWKKLSTWCLAVLLMIPMLNGVSVSAVSDSALPDVDAPHTLTDDEHDTGYVTVDFSKNGMEGSPFTSGLNAPFGYYFKLDASKKLTQISITDHATYSTNVNKGTYTLYQWKGDYKQTVASKPLVQKEIVNAQDHNDLVLEVSADLNVTGELYFEVVATSGAGYTPWIAKGGVADEIPGTVTDMQAYSKGNPSHAFACMITVADMVNQSPVKYINWTYDFGQDLTNPKGDLHITHTNQISISQAQNGYTTFKAEGDDPYFRIPDDKSPTPKANELGYVAILYRTTAAVSAGEFFTNRGGSTWGNEGTYASCVYVNDGLWHVALADANDSWGKDTDNTLYAFRFDPLMSGCSAGDTIDVAWLKFFGDGTMAQKYVDEQNKKLDTARQSERENGTLTVNFSSGHLPDTCKVQSGNTVYVQSDFIRIYGTDKISFTLSESGLKDYGFVRVIYRSESTDSVTVKSGEARETATIQQDGFWSAADIDLEGQTGNEIQFAFTASRDNAWVDIAAVVCCTEAAYRDTYIYENTLNTHRYELGETAVPVLTCTVAEVGDPYCGPGEYFGQKFVSDTAVCGVIVYNHSTWKEGNNKGIFNIWKWQGDYQTTAASQPLYTENLQNVPSNQDLRIEWDTAFEAGEYLYEIKLTDNSGNAYTGFSSKGGKAIEGAEAFRNGKANGVSLYSAYLTMGQGLQDLGEEYTMNPTAVFDFTKHIENATDTFGLGNITGCEISSLCDKGYLTVKSTSADPYFIIGSFPEMKGNLCDWIVIKYRTDAKALHGEFFVCRSDGVTWGQDYARSNVLIDWENDGEWHIAVIDATNVWGNAGTVTVNNLRFDPLEKPEGAGETIDIASVTFFANGRAADSYADSLYAEKDGQWYVPAPRIPLTPDEVHPVAVLDGERLNAIGGNQMVSALYDYKEGYITLKSQGEDPYYYLISEPTTVAPYAVIKYRTEANGVKGEISVASAGASSAGQSDRVQFTYIADGQWHQAIVNLSTLVSYDINTDTVHNLRYDFFTSGSSPVRSGLHIDVEYVAFFKTEDEAYAFEHTLPSEAQTFTLKFYADGHYITYVSYREGDASVTEPVVPKKPGMIGTWEAYTLDGDKDVNAVYTPENTEVVTLPPDETDTETATDTENATDNNTDTDTDNAAESSCRSALPAAWLITVTLFAVFFVWKRKNTEKGGVNV